MNDRTSKAASREAQRPPAAEIQSHQYKNLFERYDIDPRQGPRAITERLRELIEESDNEAARTELRAAWEELTMHPMRRLRAAFGAHPESRPELGAPPSLSKGLGSKPEIGFNELAVRPSVAAALLGGSELIGPRRTEISRTAFASQPPDSLDEDPILKRV